jgi:hypothetical protein
MKKLTTYLLFFAFAVPLGVLIGASIVFARGFPRHQPQPVPPPVVTPPSTPSGFQFGMYNNEKDTQAGTYTGFFFGDGDDFTQDLASQKVSGPIFAYWESNMTATQIENGSADSFLKKWASEMKAYGQPIIFAPLDEMNGDWSAYYGNPTAFKAAWIHVYNLFAGDSDVKFAWDPNNGPTNTIASYYPGSQYVDIVGVDGFDFGNTGHGNVSQTFAQVFDSAFATVAQFGKPMWITSTGVYSGDNQQKFVSDMSAGVKQYGIQGVIYFSQSPFVLNSTAFSTFKSLTP